MARGGGSQADLLAFSDETLCRTVALCAVPVIASVGHHTDRTLLDDVAAVSCSTPTHAAEAAVGIDCARARAASSSTAARRLREHGRRAVVSRARHLALLSRAPASRLRAPAGAAFTSSCARCAPARGGASTRELALAQRRAIVLERKAASTLLDCQRAPPPRARAARACARRPRPPAHARARLRARAGPRERRAGHARRSARAARGAAAALRRRLRRCEVGKR